MSSHESVSRPFDVSLAQLPIQPAKLFSCVFYNQTSHAVTCDKNIFSARGRVLIFPWVLCFVRSQGVYPESQPALWFSSSALWSRKTTIPNLFSEWWRQEVSESSRPWRGVTFHDQSTAKPRRERNHLVSPTSEVFSTSSSWVWAWPCSHS